MIKFQEIHENGQVGLVVAGHARYAPKGFDIVCAAISAIAQTAALGCQQWDPKIKIIAATEGDFCFTCKATSKTRAIVQAAVLGLQEIKRLHPQCFEGTCFAGR